MTKSVIVEHVGSNLVASFSRSNPPLVWTFDLDRNHSFTLSIQGDADNWELGVTSFKGEFDVVANFKQREDAEEAFHQIQRILMKKRRSFLGRIFLWLVFILIAIVILVYGYMAFEKWILLHQLTTGSLLPEASHTPVEMQDGIPLPADEVLKPPR